jgi:hypothetical protein
MSKTGKRIAFTQPSQEADPPAAAADAWVRGEIAANPTPAELRTRPSPAGRMARLTIDLPEDLHTRFKAICAQRRTKMVDEIRRFIEDWTQKTGNL